MADMLYELFEGTVVNTGWPIDGHRLTFAIWNHDKDSYHLFTWEDADDEAVMQTMVSSLIEGGFISEDEREDAIKSWKADTFYDDFVSGAFCIDLDKLADVEKVEQDA